MVGTAVQVSFLAMGVIFVVLTILIGVIKVLVQLIPYEAPATESIPAKARGGSIEDEHVAVIHAALSHHLGRSSSDIKITRISS